MARRVVVISIDGFAAFYWGDPHARLVAAARAQDRLDLGVRPPDGEHALQGPALMGFEPISAVYKAGSAYVRTMPRPMSSATAWLASQIAIEVSPARRLLVERNLQRVYGPDYRGRRLRRSVLETFRSYGRYWIDSFRLPDLSIQKIDAEFSYDGVDQIVAARSSGIGPILVLPHLGGWEWAGFWLTQVLRVPVTVVVEPIEPPELFEFFVSFRRRLGMNIVTLGPSAGAEVLRAIKERHVVCLLADRDIQGDGIPVEFFGETTTFGQRPLMNQNGGAPSFFQSQRCTSRRRFPITMSWLPGTNARDWTPKLSPRARNRNVVASYNNACWLPNARNAPSGEKATADTS